MREQILKRFLSENGKLVVAALEKWAEGNDVLAAPREVERMIEGVMQYGNYADSCALKLTVRRLEAAQRKSRALEKSAEVAAKVLMGETFKREEALTSPAAGRAAQSPFPGQQSYGQMSSQEMYQQLLQQKMAAQQAQAWGQLGGLTR